MMLRPLSNVACLSLLFTSLAAAETPSFVVKDTWIIGGAGRWDYVVVDPQTHLLYVTRSTHTQVVDPAGKVVADIDGGKGLHGVALAPAAGRGFISDGKAASVHVFDLKTDKMLGDISAADDADGIIYDAGSNRVLVGCGDAEALVAIDPDADLKTASADKIDLGGKPEFLAADGKGRAFVNLEDKSEIAVVNVKEKKVIDRWKLGTGESPAGLAIDAVNGRLFVGCHNEKMVVLDTATGKVLTELPIGKGNDACAFANGEAFASCGDGTVTVVRETAPGHFEVAQTLTTQAGARTMAVDPSTNLLYLPTAEFGEKQPGKKWPPIKPDSFTIVVAGATSAPK